MVSIRKVDNVIQEAQFLIEKRLDHELVKIFAGELAGTEEEKRLISSLLKQLGNDFYVEVIYILSHLIIKNRSEAKQIYVNIIKHRNKLNSILQRPVGLEVAAFDYLKNINPLLEVPQIIEQMKLLYLARRAITDPTTGMLDKTSFRDTINNEIERCRRYDKPLSLLFCDLDGFKRINDRYGHVTGDTVLIKTGEVISRNIRKVDRVFRFGGEEFICLLVETKLRQAGKIAERIRKEISQIKINVRKKNPRPKVTSSIGVCQFGIGIINNDQSFIEVADQMMYQAKQDGKNCVRIYQP